LKYMITYIDIETIISKFATRNGRRKCFV
jgi:hypothetical protein